MSYLARIFLTTRTPKMGSPGGHSDFGIHFEKLFIRRAFSFFHRAFSPEGGHFHI
jgi:hypothetical protein